MSLCADCQRDAADLGYPSTARWRGPDGGEYCSMHFIRRYGHNERLVRLEGYEPPARRKPAPARKRGNGRRKTTTATTTVDS